MPSTFHVANYLNDDTILFSLYTCKYDWLNESGEVKTANVFESMRRMLRSLIVLSLQNGYDLTKFLSYVWDR